MDGEWVPTFPNARYLIEAREFAYLDEEAGSRRCGAVAERPPTVT